MNSYSETMSQPSDREKLREYYSCTVIERDSTQMVPSTTMTMSGPATANTISQDAMKRAWRGDRRQPNTLVVSARQPPAPQ